MTEYEANFVRRKIEVKESWARKATEKIELESNHILPNQETLIYWKNRRTEYRDEVRALKKSLRTYGYS